MILDLPAVSNSGMLGAVRRDAGASTYSAENPYNRLTSHEQEETYVSTNSNLSPKVN